MPNENAIYQLRITLIDSEPEIWRRILVPADIKLPDLHLVLQIAMGWRNSHLHAFRNSKDSYGPMPEDGWILDEKKIQLSELLRKPKQILEYEYDMGDSWLHLIDLEAIMTNTTAQLPSCLDGKNECPPEDCGGIPGYENLQEILAKPKHPEHQDMKRWIADYGLESFSIERINGDLAALMSKLRKKTSVQAKTPKKKVVRQGGWGLAPKKAMKKTG